MLLQTAVNLYQGDLLEDVYDDWCIYERERLRLEFLDILKRLMNHHRQHSNFKLSLDFGKRILRVDPTREKVHQELMLIHWMAVMDPKNWTLPIGVELNTRNEVQDAKETQEL